MSINLELIDELKKRANVSYSDAKEALEQCNGDLLEALVYLEKNKKVKADTNCDWADKIKHLFHKGNNTRFIISKKERTALDLSVTWSAIITVCAPYVVVPMLGLGLVTGHKMKFVGQNGEDMAVNETLNKVSSAVDLAKQKLNDDSLKK
ncbi:DUF4342 domain-containing protein [Peptococcaceae bacterium 1198_IL3148]